MKLRFGRFWRVTVIVLGAGVLLLLFGSLVLRLWGGHQLSNNMERFDREVGSLELREYMLENVPEMENAATWLEAGSGGIVLTRADNRLIQRVRKRDVFKLEPRERIQTREILDRAGPALELLHRARDLGRSNYGIRYWNARDAKLPPLLDLMHARDVLYLEGALALAEGRVEEALGAYETLGTLAVSLQRERFIIILLMGLHTERMQLRLARDMLTTGLLDAATLERLQRRIPTNDLQRIGRDTLAADTASMIVSMKHGTVGGWMARWFQAVCGPMLSAQILEGHRRFGIRMSLPYPEYLADPPQYEDLRWARIFMYDMRGTTGLLAASESQRRITRTAIELQRERLTEGSYPAGIDRYPDANEPAPLTDTALEYSRANDGSARLELPEAEEALASFRPDDRTARLFRIDLPSS